MNSPPSAKRVYLDNHVFIYAFERKAEPACSQVENILESSAARLVVSIDNLLEFSLSPSAKQAADLTRAAMRYQPLWLGSFLEVQRLEVRDYIFSRFLRRETKPIVVVTDTFNGLFPDSPIEVSPIDFVSISFQAHHREAMIEKHRQHAEILKELQSHIHDGTFTPEHDAISTKGVILTRLPTRELLEIGMSIGQIRDAFEYCIRTKAELYKRCPSMNTERHLTEYRSSNHRRNPLKSDSKDLTQSSAAFPYVDEFFTQDGYLIRGLEYVRKKAPRIQTAINTLAPSHAA